MKILHVVESYGGGIVGALDSYVRNSSELDHHLVAHVRDGHFTGAREFGAFASARELPRNPFRAMASIRRAVREIQPDVVHAHSSFGGAYTRLSVRASARRPLVYTPHGYGFVRRDIKVLSRAVFYLAELVLSLNSTVIAACGQHEADLSKRFLARRVIVVPNVAAGYAGRDSLAKQPTICGLGRLSPQRDPRFFSELVSALERLDVDSDVVWVGSGEQDHVDALGALGVTVTGWKDQDEALELLSQARVYVHTAAWDGFPMSILEAQAAGCTIIVREIPALKGAPAAATAGSPGEMAVIVARILSGDVALEATVREGWSVYLSAHTDEVQRSQLQSAYGIAV